MNNLAHAYREAGELQKAQDLLHESYSLAKVTLGPDHPHTLTVMNNLALAHLAADEPTQAVQVLEQALELKKARLGEQHPVTIQAMSNLAMAYLVDGKGLQALPLLERFLADQRARVPVGDPEWIKLLEGVANNLMQFGQYAAAETYLRECLDSCEQNDGRPWMAFHFKSRIGEAMAGQARTLSLSRPDAASELFSKAETQILSAHEGMELHEERMAPEEQVRLRDSMQRLVDFYETRACDGDSDKASRWKTRLDMKKAESRSDAEDKQHRDER